jgi:CRP/FNR family cyclic AMP-dependent transcriptional regulator
MPLKSFDAGPFLAKIKRKRTTQYKTGEIIFRQGADADSACYLSKGMVKQTVTTDGREIVVEIVQPGDFFGVCDLEGRHVRVCGAFALKPCTVVTIANEDLRAAIDADSVFARLFVTHLLDRERRAQSDKAASVFSNTEQRLAHTLIELANPSGVIEPEITQEMLANMIGTTRSHVSTFMNRFRRAGLIKYNGVTQIDARALFSAILERS